MDSKSLLELMRCRRTVREYSDEPVDEGSLQRILEAATLPPSGGDYLPFTIIVVRHPESKAKIRKEAENIEAKYHSGLGKELKERFDEIGIQPVKPFLTRAPVLLVISGDSTKPYWRESTWIAIAYILLAVENENLGSLTYTPPDTGFLRSLLGIPGHFFPEVIIPIGKPLEKKGIKTARSENRVFYENYK